MARKQPIPKAKSDGAKPAAPSRKKNLVVIRGYEVWGEWLEGLAKKKGMPVTVLIDQAVSDIAKREGYPEPPARY